MIQWNLTLTGNQIAILKSLEHREFGKAHEHAHITHWIGGIRTLIRESLIEHRETYARPGIIDQTRSGQFLTDRGRFILKMVEQDIAKFLEPRRKATKREKVA